MAKHIHIHLHKPAKDAEITLKKSKVEEKCRNGEWEAMQDIVANRTLQFRNTRNGRTFFVKVEHDVSPRRQALLEQIADINQKLQKAAMGGSGDKEKLKAELLELKRRLATTDSPEAETLKKEIEKLEEEYEKRRDRGVTVTPSDMKKLQDLKDKLKKLSSSNDASPDIENQRESWSIRNEAERYQRGRPSLYGQLDPLIKRLEKLVASTTAPEQKNSITNVLSTVKGIQAEMKKNHEANSRTTHGWQVTSNGNNTRLN